MSVYHVCLITCEIHEQLLSFIPNEISRVTSHAHSCIPDTIEILMNVQISYKHSWLYLVCYNHECLYLIYIFIKMSNKMSILFDPLYQTKENK